MDWIESSYSERTARRLARAGALIRIVTVEDACEVCKARASRTYTPSEVPRLPIRGCLNDRCRCRFVAVDPETELTVIQLVERGIYAIKAGRNDLAQQILRRAVSLDEMYERGWLWLSGVVEGQEKTACLEKVLSINPRNERARQGLELLRQAARASAQQETEPVAESEPMRSDSSALAAQPTASAVPAEVLQVRQERQVILDQWADFIRLAVELDPHMLSVQGEAFLSKLQALDAEALAQSSPASRLDELYVQWQESNTLGESLGVAVEAHKSRQDGSPGWQAVQGAMWKLGQRLLQHRGVLQAEIVRAGGKVPQE